MSCRGFLKNKTSVFILKCPKRMLEYYFSKVFIIFECNTINLEKLLNEVKERVHVEDTDNYDKVMTCTTTILSTYNTLKNLAVNKSFTLPKLKENSIIKRIRQLISSVHMLNPC